MENVDNYRPNQACYCMRCRCRGLTGPVVLVTLGVLFLLSEFGVAHFDRTWPILLIVIGLVKVLGGNLDTRGHVDVMVPAPPGMPPAPPAPPSTAIQPSTPREVDHV